MKYSFQKGIALPSVLFAVLFLSIFLLATLPLIINETKHTVTSQNIISTEYTAQAGIKIAIRQALDYIADDTQALSDFEIDKSVELGSSKQTVLLKGTYIAGNNTETNPERLELHSSSNMNGVASESCAWIILDTRFIPGYQPPDVIGLIKSANENPQDNIYSTLKPQHEKWLIRKDQNQIDYGRPYNGDGYNYILFDDRLDPEFRIDYTLEYTKTSDTGAGGAGVLYGVGENDTAEDFYGYAAKFNHNMGAFSVTKFTGGDKYQQEFYSESESDMNQNNREGWGYMIQPNGTGSDQVDPLGNKVGKCAITFEDLRQEMNKYYDRLRAEKKTHLPDGREIPTSFKSPLDPGAEEQYMITVEVKYEEVDVQPGKIIWEKNADGTTKFYDVKSHTENMPKIASWEKTDSSYKEARARHIVSIDGNPVLDFYDFSDVYQMENYIQKKRKNKYSPYEYYEESPPLFIQRGEQCKINLGTTHVRTGLRVANVKTASIKFYNTPDLGYGQRLRNQTGIVWKKVEKVTK